MLISKASPNANSMRFVLSTSTLKDWVKATRYFAIKGAENFALVFEVTEDCAIHFDTQRVNQRDPFCQCAPHCNCKTKCETFGSTRQIEWFRKRTLLVVCSRRKCTGVWYVYHMTDLRFLLIRLNKCKTIKTCFFSMTTSLSPILLDQIVWIIVS